ncbi:hypothetical protein HRbin36_02705 [bacterium HR36]|nr:hypothetical protein HRbin36_02705 [bacterium HR36]
MIADLAGLSSATPGELSPQPRQPATQRAWRRALVVNGLALSACLIGLSAAHFRYNFHVVRPGQLYRSGQLPNDHWESFLRHYGIRTVINLRGEHPERDWYRAEKQAAQRCGALHLDLALDRHNLPDPAIVERLRQWHATVPRPVLVHCQAGADRTCMVVALWLLLEDDATLGEVRSQMGWRFGQLPWRHGARQLLVLLDNYETWLGSYPHSSTHFRTWLEQHYPRLVQQTHYQPEPAPIVPLVQD